MADPVKYTLTYDFSGYQAVNPDQPLPGAQVDIQFQDVEESIDEIVEAIKNIRRDDGALANEIVTVESLAQDVIDLIGTATEGDQGDPGAAATIAVGTVTTLAAGLDVTIANVGTSSAAVFDFGIPRGDPGADGNGTGDMVAATYDPLGKNGNAFSADNHVDGTMNKVFTAVEKTKLAGVETAADVTDEANVAAAIHGSSSKTTPVDNDELALVDSAAANVLKRLTWANLKATAKTYFDTIYQPLAASLTTLAGVTPGATGLALLDDTTASAGRTTLAAAAAAQTFAISGVVVAPASGDLRLVVNIPFGGTITSTTCRSASGTCTATFKINTTALGGSTNSVSTSEQTRSHSSANVFVTGDDIVMAFSSLSSPTYVSFTILYTRTLA